MNRLYSHLEDKNSIFLSIGRGQKSFERERVTDSGEGRISNSDYLTAVVIHIRSNNSSSPAELILQERGRCFASATATANQSPSIALQLIKNLICTLI